MKDMFPEYYQPTEDEFKQLWADAIFVFDANVLLDIYRYSPKASKELIGILKDLDDRIWLPYQFALEYHRNMAEVKETSHTEYSELTTTISKLQEDSSDELTRALGKFKNRTQLNINEWVET